MRGVTQFSWIAYAYSPISTRTPHAGSDLMAYVDALKDAVFQPALPMRGVTAEMRTRNMVLPISTRTPHAGSDVRLHDLL